MSDSLFFCIGRYLHLPAGSQKDQGHTTGCCGDVATCGPEGDDGRCSCSTKVFIDQRNNVMICQYEQNKLLHARVYLVPVIIFDIIVLSCSSQCKATHLQRTGNVGCGLSCARYAAYSYYTYLFRVASAGNLYSYTLPLNEFLVVKLGAMHPSNVPLPSCLYHMITQWFLQQRVGHQG